ncbi:MAG TPA: hypothetical protein VFV19_17025 [Candidatus Polarisedimenticolaceae bacterium]|nr:hypothetical protein [Candidatus Polarisedimenticolaceae bacterium]
MLLRPRVLQRLGGAVMLSVIVTGLAFAKEEKKEKAPAGVAPLWVEPTDLTSRDLFYGVGGKSLAPQLGASYAYVSADTTGHSKGYHVVGPDGRKWRIKLGDEAQSEIVVSRLLWAIGYYQPALYYVEDWKLTGHDAGAVKPGRFRLSSDHATEGEWAFDKNPFVGTRELHGLIAANLLLNNWDLAASNNRIYRVKAKHEAKLYYVAQDIGGALGATGLPIGSRNKIEDFERQEYVRGVEHGRVKFDYHGRHRGLLEDITPADVAWVCGLLARLSDQQLHDAFRAADYQPAVADRYIAKIKEKIAQGVALNATSEVPR